MIYAIIGFILGAGLLGLILGPKVKTSYEIDKKTKQENESIIIENQHLLKDQDDLIQKIDYLNYQKSDIQKDIETLKSIAKKTSDDFLQSEMELAEERFDQAMQKMSGDYQQAQEDYENEYLEAMEECTSDFVQDLQNKRKELDSLQKTLAEYRDKVHCAIESYKKEQEEKNKKDFHRVVILKDDLSEITKLREVGKTLRDQDLLNKIVWKGYYEKPTAAMIGRVVGSETKCGIYKISNLNNHMCYIGQAVNIAARWKQHIKRGLGAEPQTRNKLYPAMFEEGVENFTFEILQECKPNELDKYERYWIDYYDTQFYGYNVTKGGSN